MKNRQSKNSTFFNIDLISLTQRPICLQGQTTYFLHKSDIDTCPILLENVHLISKLVVLSNGEIDGLI